MAQISPDTVDDAWLARSRETVARINLVPQAESVGRVERVGEIPDQNAKIVSRSSNENTGRLDTVTPS